MNLLPKNAKKGLLRLGACLHQEWAHAVTLVREAHWSEWIAVFPVTLCVLGAIVTSDETAFAVTMVIGIATLFLGQLWSEHVRSNQHASAWLKPLHHFFEGLGPRQTKAAYAGMFILMALLTAAWHVGLHPLSNNSLPFRIIFF